MTSYALAVLQLSSGEQRKQLIALGRLGLQTPLHKAEHNVVSTHNLRLV